MVAPFAFAFLTWRESVVGFKPNELVQMDVRRTWDSPPVTSVSTVTAGYDVQSETLGFVRWKMGSDPQVLKPNWHLRTEAYDKKAGVQFLEEVWADESGNLFRQHEERTTLGGKEVADAEFLADRIVLSRTDTRGRTTLCDVYPAEGMEVVQSRFRPLTEKRKEFLRLDALKGSFKRVVVERSGRFSGNWGGDDYDGIAYRFTIDGREQTVMMTPQDEIVQIGFTKEIALVIAGPTRSRRAAPFNVPVP